MKYRKQLNVVGRMEKAIPHTIYQTRVVTKYVQPQIARSAPYSNRKTPVANGTQEKDVLSADQMACSMLCDDIPYELLATP